MAKTTQNPTWQTKKLSETEMICNNCRLKKNTQFCNKCNSTTPTLFVKNINEVVSVNDKSRNLMKSREKVNGKPKKEIEQYVGNKDKDVVSEFERIRNKNNKTKVIHRLYRRFSNIVKIVHNHEK